MRRTGARRLQRGQGVVETCVVMAVFGTFLLGIFQMILFYRAKSLVDYAALEAARNGATHGVDMGAMRTGLARGLLPLYTTSPDKLALLDGYKNAYIDTLNPLVSQIQVISPTKAAFADWKVKQFDGVDAIPNDSLPYRSTAQGSRSGLTVQDANVLKIRVVYGYKMIVPVIDKIILGVYRLSFYQGMSAQEVAMLESGRLPIATQAMVRMQTPIRDSGPLP